MNRFSLLCVTLGLALSPAAAVTKPKCGILKTSKKCGNVAGCSWMKTGTQKFKKCQNVVEAVVTVVATAPSVETGCSAFDGQAVKCQKTAGCDWYKTAGQRFKTCQAAVAATPTNSAVLLVETNCAAFDGQSVKCRKQDGCDWYKTAGQMHKTCQAVVVAAPVPEAPPLGRCEDWCSKHTGSTWAQRCGWTSNACTGCVECAPFWTFEPTSTPSEAPSEAPRDLGALSLEFLSMEGCCRVDYKDEKSSLIAEFMFDVLSGADEQAEYDAKFALCEENCLANSECEAFEFMQKSKPRRYRCELHRGGVNTASRGNPSCKKATCEVLEYTGEISSEAPSETPSEVPSVVLSAAPRGDVTMKGCCRVDYADKRSFSGTRIEIPEKTTKADAFNLCMAACGSEDECYAFELRHTTDKKKITKCEFFLASDSKVGELINSARPNSKTCRETECTVDLDFALQ